VLLLELFNVLLLIANLFSNLFDMVEVIGQGGVNVAKS